MKKLFVFGVAALLLLGFSVSAMAEEEVPKEIRIGSVSSITGMFAGFGEGGSWGLTQAFKDVNKLGGIYVKKYGKRIPVKHILLDCESDPVKAGTLAEDLILREKVHFLVNSQEPITVQIQKNNLCDKYKIPNVAGTGPLEPYLGVREGKLPPWQYTWCWSFGIALEPPKGDFRYGKPGFTILGTWKPWLDMFGGKTNKKVGIYASDDPDGIGWYGLFTQKAKEWGYEPIGTENRSTLFPMGTTDFRPIIENWKKNNVEIILGNCPAPDFGTLWRQARSLNFKPKMVGAARAALFYTEVNAWGGDLPLGVFIEMWWHPAYDPKECPGIGDTTPESLAKRWTQEKGQPLNIAIGWSYCLAQVMIAAIEKAGTLDREAVNTAISKTDTKTIAYRCVFDQKMHFNWSPVFIGQWFQTKAKEKWALLPVYSDHKFIHTSAKPLFPIPYK
jgi:branched-chain amino acid transport system substrate-binding protein